MGKSLVQNQGLALCNGSACGQLMHAVTDPLQRML